MVDGKYIVNVSRSPFTPRAGAPTNFLISIADVSSGSVLTRDPVMHIRIARLENPGAEPQFISEERDLKAERSILGYSYTFADSGFYELYIDFAFADDLTTVLQAPDFLFDVQPSEMTEVEMGTAYALWVLGGAVAGFALTRLLTKK